MNRKIAALLNAIARTVMRMAPGLGIRRGTLDSYRTETITTTKLKIKRRLTIIGMDLLLMAHLIEDR